MVRKGYKYDGLYDWVKRKILRREKLEVICIGVGPVTDRASVVLTDRSSVMLTDRASVGLTDEQA